MTKHPKTGALLNLISLCLAILVMAGATAYVVAEQPWFQTSVLTASADFPFLGTIRDRLSRHR